MDAVMASFPMLRAIDLVTSPVMGYGCNGHRLRIDFRMAQMIIIVGISTKAL